MVTTFSFGWNITVEDDKALQMLAALNALNIEPEVSVE